MNKILKGVAFTALVVVLGFKSGNAQGNSAIQKPIVLARNCEDCEDKISERAVRDFRRTYSSISNEYWLKASDGFIAKFTQDGIQYRVGYDLKGNWKNTIRNYDETKMPFDIRERVKSYYYDYDIVLVDEVSVRDNLVYIVHLENESGFKVVRVLDFDMEMDVLEAYQKR